MKLTYKQFVIRFMVVFIVALSGISGFVYAADPYVYYHQDSFYKRTFMKNFNMRYQMAGMLRNLDYETVFIGTSMSHNFKEESIDRELATTSLNATISGSSAREQRRVLELALTSQRVKRVFWEINYDSLAGESDRIDATFPDFLYDRNLVNDFPYLLSYEAIKKIQYQLKTEQSVNMLVDPKTFYKFGDNRKPLTASGMEKELAGVSAPPRTAHNLEVYFASFSDNMFEMVKKHPEIEFTFFYSPYPLARQKIINTKAPEMMADRLELKREIFAKVSGLDHVKVYDFQDEAGITANPANYMDRSHYFTQTNEWMLEQMAEGKAIRTSEEYEEKIARLLGQVTK